MMNYENEVKALRNKLDLIDDELIRLLVERFKITAQVGSLKASYTIGIVDHQREKNIINRVYEKVEHHATGDEIQSLTYIMKIYEEILKQSKQQQHNL